MALKPAFEGWYYKHQANGKTLALIPGRANNGAFVQAITDTESFNIPFSLSEYKKDGVLHVGDCEFSNAGIKLNIKRNGVSLCGKLEYTDLTPSKGDIMGPFRFIPMECRHRIISMKHNICGGVTLNGEELNFDCGTGYIEADSGYSFPAAYSWVQANNSSENWSVMVSVAKIPFAGLYFWGCICDVWRNGKEYRLATYRGAKILRCEHGLIELRQGKYHFKAIVSQLRAQRLAAPECGLMSRSIRESASCPARFILTKNNAVAFAGESEYASYEYIME